MPSEYDTFIPKLDWTILLFHVYKDDPQISPKKGIGSGSKNSSGGHFSRILGLPTPHHMFLQMGPQ
jgi:hypothetical protein